MTATPASHPFEIREHDAAGVHVVAVLGELDLATAPRLAVKIDTARRNGARRLVIDLTTAEFCDSTGLRALVGCRQEIMATGGRLGVAVLAESAVARMFALAGAEELLPVYEGLEPALAALTP
jgi:anti-sigma B factor antagonist